MNLQSEIWTRLYLVISQTKMHRLPHVPLTPSVPRTAEIRTKKRNSVHLKPVPPAVGVHSYAEARVQLVCLPLKFLLARALGVVL